MTAVKRAKAIAETVRRIGARERDMYSKKYSVSTRSGCLQCIVHAHNEKEAIQIAQARSDTFCNRDTVAVLSE